MEGEVSLEAYTKEQITKGEGLPEKISSINYDVEIAEGLKIDFVLKQVVEASRAIKERTDKKFVVLGSMGMYATLNELRKNGERLMLLEQRITGGKNDYDIGVMPDALDEVMVTFGWGKDEKDDRKKLQRGKIREDGQMLDMLSREELKHFPWRQVEVSGQSFLVQTPEEMIFEKMIALADTGEDEESNTKPREIKWGVDIKILKAYLMEKNNWGDSEVEDYLKKNWETYQEDKRYSDIVGLAEKLNSEETAENILKTELSKRFSREVTDLRGELISIFGQKDETAIAIDALLNSSTEQDFYTQMKYLKDLLLGPKLSYEETSKRANEEYSKLLEV